MASINALSGKERPISIVTTDEISGDRSLRVIRNIAWLTEKIANEYRPVDRRLSAKDIGELANAAVPEIQDELEHGYAQYALASSTTPRQSQGYDESSPINVGVAKAEEMGPVLDVSRIGVLPGFGGQTTQRKMLSELLGLFPDNLRLVVNPNLVLSTITEALARDLGFRAVAGVYEGPYAGEVLEALRRS